MVMSMDAYKILEDNGMTDLLIPIEYKQPAFLNWEKVEGFFCDIIRNNRKTYIIGDYDVDGLMCNLILKDGLSALGVTNHDIYQYRCRMHSLDVVAVQQCVQGRYDYCIIADCGSNNISLLRKLLNYGIKVILLDHHETMTSYAEFDELGDIVVINTTLESVNYDLSAGALCYCVMHELCNLFNVDEHGLAAYALVSLYADCMNMHNELNRGIYHVAAALSESDLPHNITMFMNQYQKFTARFITFWYAPRINAMFRSEQLNVLNALFLTNDILTTQISECLTIIEEQYNAIRDLVLKVSDIAEVTEWENFVISDLSSVNSYINVSENKLWNYTGLIANKLSDRTSKAALVVCPNGNVIKGSVRDIFGRDYLSSFSQLCRAEGHNAAFGLEIRPFDFDNFITNLERVSKKFSISSIPNKPIILDYPYMEPNECLIEDVAMMNEFASPGVPVILLRKQRVGAMKEYKTDLGYKYNWGRFKIQSQSAIPFGNKMLLRPVRAWSTKLIVQ